MTEPVSGRTWLNRGVFVMLAVLMISLALLPLDLRPTRFAGPDFLVLATLVLVIRSPQTVPVAIIAAVFLLDDMISMRPPGLWTLIMLGLTEVLRRKRHEFLAMGLLLEWGAMATWFALAAVLYLLAHLLLVVPLPPMGLFAMQICATIVVYPVITGLVVVFDGLKPLSSRARQMP